MSFRLSKHFKLAGLTKLALCAATLVAMVAAPLPVTDSAQAAGSSIRLKAANANGRHISLGLNKSIVIETPRNVRDILVSNPKIADAVVRSARRVYLIGMAVGQANVILFDGQGGQIASFEINVARDNSSLESLIRRMIPQSNIKVEGVGEGVILSGSARNPADAQKAMDMAASYVGDAKKVSNYIAVQASEQVQLRVTVAEVQRNVFKQLGIDTNYAMNRGILALSGGIANSFSSNSQALSDTNIVSRIGGFNDGIQTQLRALERNGLVRTLAEPNITAISGEKANFLAGGEFPVPVGLEDGKISIEFKPYGVALGFRPIVLSENRISLQVKTEVSELSKEETISVGTGGAALAIPGLKVRRSESTIELPSGGTMAMAGLLRDELRKSIDGFPGLKDLPVLGTLFRSNDYKRNQTELVIFITPYIVKPNSRSKFEDPGRNLDIAGDANSYFMGQINRKYDLSGNGRRGTKYYGRYGYSYE
ncbi:MAG: type II and III secretion system protein family protein [Cohaesibacter sp.]|jgi:pilus assembly protein CpaC|nr:type II and III secretion system protein family protein [Cohaesibacter sp.]